MAQKNNQGLGKGLGAIFGQDVDQIINVIENNAADVPGRKEI